MRHSIATAAVVAAIAAAVVSAPAAYADTVDVHYKCKTPIGDKSAVDPIDITAVKSGSGYKLTMSFKAGVSSSPVELGKGTMNPSALITLGGVESGSVRVKGPANSAVLPANTPIKISDLTGTYTPSKSGKATFTAGVLTITALGTTTTCTPTATPAASLTLTVTASGSSSSSSGGGDALPQTGPDDGAVALGTFGGTVLLLGASGVLWLTRRSARSSRGGI